MHVEPYHTEAEPDRLIAREKHAVRVKRLRAVRLALGGLDAPTVAERTGYSRRSVQTWVARYNAAGPPGLEDAPGRVTKPPLDADREQRGRVEAADRPRPTASPPCGARTSAACSKKSSASSAPSAPCTTCCTAWATRRSGPAPDTPEGDPAKRDAFRKNCRTS